MHRTCGLYVHAHPSRNPGSALQAAVNRFGRIDVLARTKLLDIRLVTRNQRFELIVRGSGPTQQAQIPLCM